MFSDEDGFLRCLYHLNTVLYHIVHTILTPEREDHVMKAYKSMSIREVVKLFGILPTLSIDERDVVMCQILTFFKGRKAYEQLWELNRSSRTSLVRSFRSMRQLGFSRAIDAGIVELIDVIQNG